MGPGSCVAGDRGRIGITLRTIVRRCSPCAGAGHRSRTQDSSGRSAGRAVPDVARGAEPHDPAAAARPLGTQNYARVVSDLDESDQPDGSLPETWTTRYRIPITIASGFLGLLFFWLLFDGSAAEKWIAGFGFVALIV